MIYPSSITLKKPRRYQSSHDFSLPSQGVDFSMEFHPPGVQFCKQPVQSFQRVRVLERLEPCRRASGAWSTSVHGPRQALLQTQVRREVPGLGPFSVKVPEIGWKSVNGLFLAVNL